ncbi:hypothetical protein SSAG_04788 [Streptomyces sp. Mg1]|nr:hypothetical protein SSAG_04788 [Streptomyces sp. Mg1]
MVNKVISGLIRPWEIEEERGGNHLAHFGDIESKLLFQEPQRDSPVRPASSKERRDGLLNDIPEEHVGQDTLLVEDVRVKQVLEAGRNRDQVPHQLTIPFHGTPSPGPQDRSTPASAMIGRTSPRRGDCERGGNRLRVLAWDFAGLDG